MNTASSQNLPLRGVWCPSVTPFTDNGSIDIHALGKHFERLTASGIDGILLNGSIGEFTALSIDERKELIRAARKLTPLPMMVNVSTTCVDDMVRLADLAFDSGYNAVMALPHYYFSQTEHQLEEYYRELGRRFSGPWMAYNFPARTGCDLNAALIARLAAEMLNMVGIKDTVDCQSHTRAIVHAVRNIRPDFSVFAGYDEYLAPNWLVGGAGVISGLNNVVPALFVQLRQALQNNDLKAFAQAQSEISRLSAIYTIGDDFVTTIKTAVARKFHSINPQSRNYGGALNAAQCKAIDEMFSAY